jgi:hypothetical protein
MTVMNALIQTARAFQAEDLELPRVEISEEMGMRLLNEFNQMQHVPSKNHDTRFPRSAQVNGMNVSW